MFQYHDSECWLKYSPNISTMILQYSIVHTLLAGRLKYYNAPIKQQLMNQTDKYEYWNTKIQFILLECLFTPANFQQRMLFPCSRIQTASLKNVAR